MHLPFAPLVMLLTAYINRPKVQVVNGVQTAVGLVEGLVGEDSITPLWREEAGKE